MSATHVHPNLLDDLPEIPEESIISRTLIREPGLHCVLFGFAPGQELTEHTSPRPGILQVLSGRAQVVIAGQEHPLEAGSLIYLPPEQPHAVRAEETLIMLLTLGKGAGT